MRLAHSALALGLVALGAPALAQSAPTPLAPHRAVYDLSLENSGGTRTVENARGRIAFDFLGNECEGYSLNYRQVTILETSESGSKTSDLRNTTYEAADGTSFRFRTDKGANGSESVSGSAERERNEGVRVRLTKPAPGELTLDPSTLFPSAHMKRLINAARNGERTATDKVFDGADDGRKLYDTLAVIGGRIEGAGRGDDPALKDPGLSNMPRWPVTLSYFTAGQGERTPIYVISFEMYENGVSRALRLDYNDFVLKGDLTRFELLPNTACQR